MICPRWTPRATAILANNGNSSRQGSSRHLLRPSKEPWPRRRFNTNEGNGGDGISGSPPHELLLPMNKAHGASPRRTVASTTGPTSNPLPRRRTWKPATSAANRPHNKPDTGETRRIWISRSDRGGSNVEKESEETPRQLWPQLQRRKRGGKRQDGFAVPKNPFSPRRKIQNPQGTTDSSFIMLIIHGLSPNLNATDFYRIVPNELSNWQSAIQKVQQQRKVDTLEPLGRYCITFSTSQAAASYRDRLVRLYKLNGFKLRSASGLWESSVPSSLKVSLASPWPGPTAVAAETSDAATSDTPPGTETLVDLVNTFTIAPGSQALLPMQRKRIYLVRPWTNRLARLVENLGYGERPSTLMVDIYPPTLTALELRQFIHRDGQNRGLRWKVSFPIHLRTNNSGQRLAKMDVKRGASGQDEMNEQDESDEQQSPFFWRTDREALEKLKGRFIIACADEVEARRFQQSWNHRTLRTMLPQPAKYLVHTSIINW